MTTEIDLHRLEAAADLENVINEMMVDINDGNHIESSVERLIGLAETIEKYGISRPMMEAADPQGELVDAGICCAYEGLSDMCVKDETSLAVVESIYDVSMLGPQRSFKEKIEADKAEKRKAAESKPKSRKEEFDDLHVDVIKNVTNEDSSGRRKETAEEKADRKRRNSGDVADKAVDDKPDHSKHESDDIKVETKYSADDIINDIKKGKKDESDKALHGKILIGIGVALAIAAFVKFLFYIIPKFRKLSVLTQKSIEANEASLKQASQKFSEVKLFDGAKFLETEATIYSKESFHKILDLNDKIVKSVNGGSIQKLIDELSTMMHSGHITKDYVDTVYGKAEAIVKSLSMGDTDKPTKGSLGNHGWAASDVSGAIHSASMVLHHGDHLAAQSSDAGHLCHKLGEWMKSHFNKEDGVTEAEKLGIKAAIIAIRSMMDSNHSLIVKSISNNNKLCETALQLSRAAIKCKKE